MVSQLLFGEQCSITDSLRDHWIRIRCHYDQYEGWCQEHQLQRLETAPDNSPVLSKNWISKIELNSQSMVIPFGSSLNGITNGILSWGSTTIKYNDEFHIPSLQGFSSAALRDIASLFLNTAYLWGGKSIFGVDCSGFCQTVFKYFGVPLLRDAYQQATMGEPIGFLQEAKCGDLAFFDNEDGKITHVGILLSDKEIIHSSVKVRVDAIDAAGIINRDTKERTHRLRMIKRIIPESY
jgi:cell wall-associated NlpC family hydrolase